MRRLILYISTSEDGFIADRHGSVEWMNQFPVSEDLQDEYSYFYDQIDTIIMGNNTYMQIVNELTPDEWIYDDKICYVFTHDTDRVHENIRFVNASPQELLADIRNNEGKDIWLMGGADLINQFATLDLIDQMIISIYPITLGEGIPLFYDKSIIDNFTLDGFEYYEGMVERTYTKTQK